MAAVLIAACGSSGTVASTGARWSTGGPVTSTGAAAAPPATPATASSQAGGVRAAPPWPVPADQVALIRKAGLTPLTAEGTVQHTHSELQVWYQGQRVTVPAQVGIDATTQQLSPIHTHDRTGIIHVESPTPGTFYLGQFFTEWGVSLAGARAWVDGQPTADPAGIVLRDHQMIVVAWGPPPSPVPSSYTEGYYPGVVPPDVAPGITLAGLPQGFPVPTVSLRTNDDIAYLDTLTDQGAQREQPLVARKLRVFEVKASQSQQSGTVDVILWGFDSRASAQDYLARSGVFVTGTPQAAPSVAAGAQLVFGPDPNQSDGSTLGQVAWVHGPWAIVVLEATAPGVIDQNGLIRLAATVEQEAAGLPAP